MNSLLLSLTKQFCWKTKVLNSFIFNNIWGHCPDAIIILFDLSISYKIIRVAFGGQSLVVRRIWFYIAFKANRCMLGQLSVQNMFKSWRLRKCPWRESDWLTLSRSFSWRLNSGSVRELRLFICVKVQFCESALNCLGLLSWYSRSYLWL